MYLKRKLQLPSSENGSNSCNNDSQGHNRLFKRPKLVCVVQRAPFFGGGITASATPSNTQTKTIASCGSVLQKKFQRPVLKRRAYGKTADAALQQASLGPKRRMDGMAKLLARAGRGLSYKLPSSANVNASTSDTDGSSDSEDDNDKEPDRPFDPLRVWKSPHNNATATITDNTAADDNDNPNKEEDDDEPLERKGLPPKLVQIQRLDEYGVEETVTVLQPAPVSAYAKTDIYVPPVLAKWLRPQWVFFAT